MTTLTCRHPGCTWQATISVLKDPFGKSDVFVSYCAAHAPQFTRPREDATVLAAKKAREIFSERHHAHPVPWRAVHLSFDELAAIIESVIEQIRNEELK